MFQAIGLVSAARPGTRSREIKTFWLRKSKRGGRKSKPGRNHIDAIPAANPIERQVIPSGTRHEHQA
jgi:hypothetical protein